MPVAIDLVVVLSSGVPIVLHPSPNADLTSNVKWTRAFMCNSSYV